MLGFFHWPLELKSWIEGFNSIDVHPKEKIERACRKRKRRRRRREKRMLAFAEASHTAKRETMAKQMNFTKSSPKRISIVPITNCMVPNINICPNILLATLSGNWTKNDFKDDAVKDAPRTDCLLKEQHSKTCSSIFFLRKTKNGYRTLWNHWIGTTWITRTLIIHTQVGVES